MKTSFLIFNLTLWLLILYSCEKTLNITCLKTNAKDITELYHILLKQDTLQIVAGCDFLYDPFGSFNNFNEFAKSYPNLANIKTEMFHHYDDTSNEVDTLFRIVSKDSYIKFINIDETEDEDNSKNRLMLVSAKINGPEIEFINDIKIGITKKQFINTFFKGNCFLGNIKIFEMESALTGIWYYFHFQNGLLKQIIIKTDFQVNQE